jgi:hypothetical protein
MIIACRPLAALLHVVTVRAAGAVRLAEHVPRPCAERGTYAR